MSQAVLERPIWVSHASNKETYIDEMPDEYLQATIAMIKRGYDRLGRVIPKSRDIVLPALEAEAIKRGLQPAEDGWDK